MPFELYSLISLVYFCKWMEGMIATIRYPPMDPSQVFRHSCVQSHVTVTSARGVVLGSHWSYPYLHHVRFILEEEQWHTVVSQAPRHTVNITWAEGELRNLIKRPEFLEPLVALLICHEGIVNFCESVLAISPAGNPTRSYQMMKGGLRCKTYESFTNVFRQLMILCIPSSNSPQVGRLMGVTLLLNLIEGTTLATAMS